MMVMKNIKFIRKKNEITNVSQRLLSLNEKCNIKNYKL